MTSRNCPPHSRQCTSRCRVPQQLTIQEPLKDVLRARPSVSPCPCAASLLAVHASLLPFRAGPDDVVSLPRRTLAGLVMYSGTYVRRSQSTDSATAWHESQTWYPHLVGLNPGRVQPLGAAFGCSLGGTPSCSPSGEETKSRCQCMTLRQMLLCSRQCRTSGPVYFLDNLMV